MGAFTTALLAAGTVMKVVGQVKAGQDAQAAAEYNAAILRQQAESIDVKQRISNKSWDRLINQLGGKLTTAVASSGYDYSGSFLAVVNDRMTQAYLDKQIENYNLELSKTQSLSAADEAQRAGARARTASLFQAGGTILTEGNEWYSKYGRTDVDPGGVGIGGGTPGGSKYAWAQDYPGGI
jgi:type II secretory pathway pseudopilin PulG